MNEFRRVALGEVVHHDVAAVTVTGAGAYPIVGVLNRGRGLLQREPITAAGTKYAKLNIVREGQLVYSKLKAFEGAVTVATGLHDGLAYASPEFPTFTCGPAILPSYMRLVTCLPSFWDDLARLSTGIGGRRERVAPRDLLTVELPLPPISVQQRITDLTSAVDVSIAALDEEWSAAEAMLRELRSHAFSDRGGWAVAALGDLAAITIGRTPPVDDAAYWTTDPAHPFVTIGDMADWRVQTARRCITELAIRDGKVRPVPAGQLLMSFKLSIGRLAFTDRTVYPNEAIAWIRPHEGELVSRKFLAHWLANCDLTGASVRAVKGATLNSKSLAAIQVAVPPSNVQAELVNLLEAARTTAVAARIERDSLSTVRSALLPALLSGYLEIPESYDELVGAL